MTIPDCCGERMSHHATLDAAFCRVCQRELSAEELLARHRRYVPIPARVTIDKATLDAAKADSSMFEAVRKKHEEAIAHMLDQAAHPRVFVKEPDAFNVRTSWGDITIRSDPRVPPGVVHLRKPLNPLDVKYDDVPLCVLLERDRFNRREHASRDPDREARPFVITPAQRAAVSAHWSAELRAKVAASRERERRQVVLDCEEP
jgi:hypothetical protein